ncbi:MAG TPA: NAD(P)/FAD-dependent oxidoreductase [Vicinamibacterales bacterium]|nr:NAD(P)/FAD-dependent oxidoreductase [Vicinamibacterales bacterium]
MNFVRVVIVGGGFGGLSAAKVLRNREGVHVTLLDRRNHHVFQPLLYQVATATLSAGDIAAPIRWVLRKARNLRVLLGEASRLDVAQRRVELTDGAAIEYDYLIVATGASHAYFGHPEWERFAPGLKTLEDAFEIRRRILLAFERAERETDTARKQELLTFVLVGGGPTGVELAGTLAEIARQTLRDEFRSIDTATARIVLIEAGPSILPTFPEKLRDAARRSLRRLGVDVREGARVTGIDGHGVTIDGVERLTAGTVLWAAGVAASPLLSTLGVPLDGAGRVKVEPDLSIPGHPEVFVVGDAAAFHQGGRLLPGVAQTAMQGAAHAARTILARMRGKPSTPFVYRDYGSMAIVGRGSAVTDLNWARYSGVIAWLSWLFLHIFMLIGFRNRVIVLLEWAVAYVTFQRNVRLITEPAHTVNEPIHR